jgi:GBP family porin
MRKVRFSAALLVTFAGAAHAQSSVTLFGIVDVGMNYISNESGKPNWTMTSGVVQGSRFGLRVVEDLGGGLKAVAQLENGFSVTNGALGQGGRLFGRQGWVGLSSNTFGTLTLGRQYDSMVDFVQPKFSIVYTGLAHPFDNDNLGDAFRINNSIKYTSAVYKGFKFGGLYGFSNSASTSTGGSGFANNRAWSLGANYTNGPFDLGVGYLHLNTPGSTDVGAVVSDYINVSTKSALGSNGLATAVLRHDVVAAGGTYQFSKVKLGLVYSHSKIESATDRLSFDNYEVNFGYVIVPEFALSGAYIFTDGKLASTGATPKYHQVELIGDYLLSKRTDAYLLGAYQRAAGDAKFAQIAPQTYDTPGDYSTNKNQVLVRIGLRHRF